jgi:hypothetical protein
VPYREDDLFNREVFMMKHLLCVALLSPVWTMAALPPLYQGIKELQALLDDPDLSAELTSGEVIESIKKTESGYEVQTNRSRLQVDVHYKPQSVPGPVSFDLQFHKAERE